MTNAGNDTAGSRQDELFTSVYRRVADTEAARYAAGYDLGAGRARLAGWLQDHAGPELDADQAVAELYSRHYQQLVRLAAVLVGDTPTAESIVQDAFTAMHQGWRRLGTEDEALAYLRQAVVNRSRSVLRHRSTANNSLQQWRPETSGPAPAGDLLARPGSQAALNELPQRQREAIVLRYYSGLAEDQVAAAMGISRGAVKSHIARGLAALRSALL